ncbi:MAG: cytochrome c1 [Burkholderiaceae bacterium]
MLSTLKLTKLFAAGLTAAAALLSSIPAAQASEGGYPLDVFPASKLTDQPALQSGARMFVNYCLSCHAAQSMRYNRLMDLGLTEEQIKENLLFTGTKVGDLMKVAISPADAKAWFGANPPDLSVVARARASHDGSGADWLYTYLRSYYRDATRPTGWNNALYENVGMPHVLWQLQGARGATITEVKAAEGGHDLTKTVVSFDATGARTEKTEKVEGHSEHEGRTIELGKASGGQLSQAEFDDTVADLVAYLTYMADPSAKTRHRIGVWVLLFLGVFTIIAWNLNRVYWKDVK